MDKSLSSTASGWVINLRVLKVGAWESPRHTAASISDSKFKHLRDNKIMGTVAFNLNIQASAKLLSGIKCYTIEEYVVGEKGRGEDVL